MRRLILVSLALMLLMGSGAKADNTLYVRKTELSHDFILGMDKSNMQHIAQLDPGDGKAKVAMLLDLVPGQNGREVGDPYYGGADGFRQTWAEVEAGANALVAVLIDRNG